MHIMKSAQMATNEESPEQVTPYNPKNNLLSHDQLTSLLSCNGIDKPYHNINIYRLALVHKSYCTRKNENFINGNTNCPAGCIALQESSNERLEFLGDSVLNLVVANYLFDRFPDSEEGFLTRIRTKLVNGQMLGVLSEKVGFDKYIMISKQIEDNNGRKNQKILEDVFEAFIGAIFLDFEEEGFQMATDFIIDIIESNIDFSELIVANHNYKDMLLKYFQHNFSTLPKFVEISVETKQNAKIYTIGVKNKEGMLIATGKGATKKHSENDAALNALRYFGQLA
jgi:ribonuclease III